MHFFVSRFEPSLDKQAIGLGGGICVEISHHKDFVVASGLAFDPEEDLRNLVRSDVLVCGGQRVVQMRIDEDKVAVCIATRVTHLDHLAVSHSAQVQHLIRARGVSAEKSFVCCYSIPVDVETWVGARPDCSFLNLKSGEMLFVISAWWDGLRLLDFMSLRVPLCAKELIKGFWAEDYFLKADYFCVDQVDSLLEQSLALIVTIFRVQNVVCRHAQTCRAV